MKFLYVGVTLIGIAFVFGCSGSGSAREPTQADRIERNAYLEKMNIIQSDLEYSTYCLKGKRVIYSDRNLFYELDDLGHPIPCNAK